MLNYTGNETNQECLKLKVTDFILTPGLKTAHIVTLIVNSVTAFTAIFGNLMILIAVSRTRSLYSPSNVLLCCLALSDLLVGLVAQPCFVGHKIGELTNNLEIYCITRVVSETAGFITVGVSTLTLTAISVEKYFALKLHLRYREVVTCKKVLLIAGSFWILLFTFAGLRFVVYTEVFEATVVFAILLSLSVTPLCYYKIFKTVKRHENQIKALATQKTTLSVETNGNDKPSSSSSRRNMLKYKKSTIAMVYILGVFLVCYVPTLLIQTSILLNGYTKTAKIAYVYISTVLLVNSSLNPAIYCWRMSDIRRAVRSVLSKFIPYVEAEESSNYTLDRTNVHLRTTAIASRQDVN